MPLVQTRGAASAQGFGEFAQASGGGGANYIEDVFSTYLYTGNTTAQSITNGIDLAGKGGMVWLKSRTSTAVNNLWDTSRTPYFYLVSNDTVAQQSVGSSNALTAYNANGFTVTGGSNAWNGSQNYVSWTFRKQPKFFDVVTYTGNGGASQTINHNLGSVPGCMIVKSTSTVENWKVYHRSLGTPAYEYLLNLNTTDSVDFSTSRWASNPTSTTFSVASNTDVNASGVTYVVYLFAHNAGGFGLTGTDNVISCGSFSTDGAGSFSVNLGYEPQWLMIKSTNNSGVSAIRQNWLIYDNMRGLGVQPNGSAARLFPNLSNAESSSNELGITATGFESIGNQNPSTGPYIYIAIRRGPMKVPTSGTSVFSPVAETPSGSASYVMNSSSGFPVDMLLYKARNNAETPYLTNRLTNNYLQTASTAAEAAYTYGYDLMQGVRGQFTATSQVDYAFRRAPSFFDQVCYTGDSTAGRSVNHNLGVEPELMIVKTRSGTTSWQVYAKPLGVTTGSGLLLDSSDAAGYNTVNGFYATPTSSVFYLGTGARTNVSGATYVNYLFASCAGVSKVGSYTGNGTTQTINCGFGAGGARFVLIKRTDDTGDWYVYDTARGMTVLTDPYLLLNTTGAEVATLGSVTTVSTGFALNSTILAAINVSAASYIFLAIS